MFNAFRFIFQVLFFGEHKVRSVHSFYFGLELSSNGRSYQSIVNWRHMFAKRIDDALDLGCYIVQSHFEPASEILEWSNIRTDRNNVLDAINSLSRLLLFNTRRYFPHFFFLCLGEWPIIEPFISKYDDTIRTWFLHEDHLFYTPRSLIMLLLFPVPFLLYLFLSKRILLTSLNYRQAIRLWWYIFYSVHVIK